MPTRPKPTKQLMLEMCGGNQYLIESLHHGLHECPAFSALYPVLNLDELMEIAPISWQSRMRAEWDAGVVKSSSIYGLLIQAQRRGKGWLDKHINVSQGNQQKYNQLNPFTEELSDRLRWVDQSVLDQLQEELAGPVKEYVFRCDPREGDYPNLVRMTFLNVYRPKRDGKNTEDFAAEVSRILSGYPREYLAAPQSKPVLQPQPTPQSQGLLFD